MKLDDEAVTVVDVPKVRQVSHWDCGLACIQMVLRRMKRCVSFDEMRKLCPTQSVWTIDLARLLSLFEIQFVYFTTQIGVNPDYSGADFYKESYETDEKRVNRLFADSPQLGIRIEHRTFSSEEIQATLRSGRHVYVALVDKRFLECASCGPFGAVSAAAGGKRSGGGGDGGRGDLDGGEEGAADRSVRAHLSSLVSSCIPSAIASAFSQSSYIGHYVVVVGVDSARGHFLVKDPARGADLCHVAFGAFERARRSFGTDEDLLLINVEG